MKEKKKNKKSKNKMEKKAFTLIELLAVIIILGIIMIIAIPSVTNYISTSRKNSYITTAKSIMDGARNFVNEGKLNLYDPNTTYYIPNTCINTENSKKSPYGNFTKAYVVVTYNFNGDGFKYYWTSTDTSQIGIKTITSYDELSIDDILSNVNDEDININVGINGRENIEIYNSDCTSSDKVIALTMLDTNTKENTKAVIKCTTDGELTQGKEFVNGQFTYRYMQENNYNNNWGNISTEGWGVKLTNPESTEEVNTNLCTTINDKPLVSTSYMFNNSKTTKINTESYNTINVTNMNGMFYYTENLKELDLSTINTSSVINFQSMFNGASNIEKLNMDNFDFSSLTSENNLGSMFNGMNKIKEISMKKWIIPAKFESAVGCRYSALCSNSLEKIDVSNWHLGKTKNIQGLFGNYPGKTIIGLDTWDTSNIANMTYLFMNSYNLEEINLNNFIKGNYPAMPMMFSGCEKLEKVFMDNWDLSNALGSSIGGGLFSGTTGIKYLSAKNWKLPKKFDHWISRSWSASNSPIEEIDVTGWDLSNTESIQGIFADSKALKEIVGLETWDTTNVNDISQLFANCISLEELDLSSFDLSNVESTNQILSNMNSLKKIITPKRTFNDDVRKIELPGLFLDAEEKEYLKIEKDTPNNILIIRDELAILDVGKVVNVKMKKLAGDSANSYTWSDFKIKKIKRSESLPDTSDFNDNNIISSDDSKKIIYAWFEDDTIYYYSKSKKIILNSDASYMFNALETVDNIDLSSIDSSNTKDMSYMFHFTGEYTNSESFKIIGLDKLNVSNVTNMSSMFENCAYSSKVKEWNIGNLEKWDVSNVKNFSKMFNEAGVFSTIWTVGDLSNWNLKNAVDLSYMFSYAGELAETWNIGKLKNWNTANVENMSFMFQYAARNTDTAILDLTNWNTSKVKNMTSMFDFFGSQASSWSIGDLSRWNTSNVTSIALMFREVAGNATSWAVGNLGSWDIHNVTNLSYTFCASAKKATSWYVGDLSRWNTSNVVDMQGTFSDAGYNALNWNVGNLSNWNTAKVKYMSYMFSNSGYNSQTWNIGTLDKWDTSKVEYMNGMFERAGYNSTNWSSIGHFKVYKPVQALGVFRGCIHANATVDFYDTPGSYNDFFSNASTKTGSKIVVNYKSNVTDIDKIIKTKYYANSNVVKGTIIR